MCHRVSLLEHLPLMFEAMFVFINTSEFLEEKFFKGFLKPDNLHSFAIRSRYRRFRFEYFEHELEPSYNLWTNPQRSETILM